MTTLAAIIDGPNAALRSTHTCPVHGQFEARCLFLDTWSKCPSCFSARRAAESAQEKAKAKAAEVARWQQRIGMAGIPDRFRDRTLESYVGVTPCQLMALAFAQDYANRFDHVKRTGRSALFIGKPGTGKTHLAIGIAQAAMQRWDASVLFTSTLRAIRRVKDTWRRGSAETESDAIAALVFPDLLILDEVGIQFGSNTEKLILFDVLNSRYEKRAPSLLLSNLTLSEVRGFLGERVFDRLREDGGEVVVFDWASYRGADKQASGRGHGDSAQDAT